MVDSNTVLWGQTIIYTCYCLAILAVIGLIVAAFSNGWDARDAEPWDVSRLARYTELLIARLDLAHHRLRQERCRGCRRPHPRPHRRPRRRRLRRRDLGFLLRLADEHGAVVVLEHRGVGPVAAPAASVLAP